MTSADSSHVISCIDSNYYSHIFHILPCLAQLNSFSVITVSVEKELELYRLELITWKKIELYIHVLGTFLSVALPL